MAMLRGAQVTLRISVCCFFKLKCRINTFRKVIQNTYLSDYFLGLNILQYAYVKQLSHSRKVGPPGFWHNKFINSALRV